MPPHEHDAFCCLPMNTTTTLFLCSDLAMSKSPRHTYARVGVRDPTRMYTYVAVFSFLHPGRLYYHTCAPLHPLVYMYIHVRGQNDNATYDSTRWVPTVRHFLACEDVAGGSQQSGGEIRWPVRWVPLSGGGIIILHVIRRHFLAAAVDLAVSLSMYSPLQMHVGR